MIARAVLGNMAICQICNDVGADANVSLALGLAFTIFVALTQSMLGRKAR